MDDGSHTADEYSRVGLTRDECVGCTLHMCRAFAQVPSQKAKSLGCFGHCSIYMFVPCEVVCQVYTEILSTVYHFQCVSVEPVDGLSLEALVDVNSDDLTLLRMELHLPLLPAHLDPLAVSWRHHLF